MEDLDKKNIKGKVSHRDSRGVNDPRRRENERGCKSTNGSPQLRESIYWDSK